jgi:4,5-dihydroxyphthalate decarboxylase
MHELGQIGHLHATLPWPVHAYDRAQQIMGEDYWPYGAHENKHALETLARYSFQQGLSVRQVPLDEMFAKPTYELSKI